MSTSRRLPTVMRIVVTALVLVVVAAPLGVLALQASSSVGSSPARGRRVDHAPRRRSAAGPGHARRTRQRRAHRCARDGAGPPARMARGAGAGTPARAGESGGRRSAPCSRRCSRPWAWPSGSTSVALRVGVAGSSFGVVVAHLVPVLPYVVVTLAAGFARHDRLLEAQAAVLGASDRQRLLLVTLPSMRGSIAVAAALGFVVSWSQYLVTVLVGSGKVITITTLLFGALAGGNPTRIGGLALVTALPAVVLLVIAARTRARRRSDDAHRHRSRQAVPRRRITGGWTVCTSRSRKDR